MWCVLTEVKTEFLLVSPAHGYRCGCIESNNSNFSALGSWICRYCMPMNNSNPAGTWTVMSGIMAPNGHSYCPVLPLDCPLLEGYQDSAIWAMVPHRVPSKPVQPALEEWAQHPCRTGLDEEADLGEEFCPLSCPHCHHTKPSYFQVP